MAQKFDNPPVLVAFFFSLNAESVFGIDHECLYELLSGTGRSNLRYSILTASLGWGTCPPHYPVHIRTALSFSKPELRSLFQLWAGNNDSIVEVCLPLWCHREPHIAAYLICLLATQSERCIQIVDGTTRLPYFAEAKCEVLNIQDHARNTNSHNFGPNDAQYKLLKAWQAVDAVEARARHLFRSSLNYRSALKQYYSHAVNSYNSKLGLRYPMSPEEGSQVADVADHVLADIMDERPRVPVPDRSTFEWNNFTSHFWAPMVSGVCLRDRYTDTDYHTSLLPESILTGKRIEVITMIAPDIPIPIDNRLISTRVSKNEFRKVWRTADFHWSGLSRFVHNGAGPSERCPDCSNVAHFLSESFLANLIVDLHISGNISQTVVNLHSSIGSANTRIIQEDIITMMYPSPIWMGPDEVHCFDHVLLTSQSWARGVGVSRGVRSTIEINGLYPGYIPAVAFSRVRSRFWSALRSYDHVQLEGQSGCRVLVYGRQNEARRKWLNADDVAASIKGELIDLRGLSWRETGKMLKNAGTFVTMLGGHLVQLMLWMAAGSLVVGVGCIELFRGYPQVLYMQDLLRAFSLKVEWVEYITCPRGKRIHAFDFNEVFVPASAHPVRSLVAKDPSARTVSVTDYTVSRMMCSYVYHAGSNASTIPESRPPYLELLENVTLNAALKRCLEWHRDCEMVVPSQCNSSSDPADYYLHVEAADAFVGWRRLACTSLSDDNPPKAQLVDRRKLGIHLAIQAGVVQTSVAANRRIAVLVASAWARFVAEGRCRQPKRSVSNHVTS